MSSRTKRVLVLAFSKTINYLVQFITPIVLTRIFDKEVYGQYREFFIYSGLVATFINFTLKDSILFFISKYPNKVKQYVTQTLIMLFITYLLGAISILIFKEKFIALTTYDFFYPLLVYVFLIHNFDYLENYWLAKKRSDYVLYYSGARIVLRVLIVVTTALISKDLFVVLYAAIVFEGIRFIFNAYYTISNNLLIFKFDLLLVREQMKYILPLGTGALLLYLNTEVSKVLVSVKLGAASLATYSIASQNVPIVNLIRSSIGQVIFPEMAQSNKEDALRLWKRSNIFYIFLMSPLFFLLFYYADVVISTLFGSQYLDAVPIYRIYLFYFLKQCFEMGSPIKAMNKNKFFLYGYIYTTLLNLILIYILFDLFGIYGPALAYVISEILLAVFFGNRIIKIYNIKAIQLLYWKKVFIILSVGIICLPILFLGNLLEYNSLLEAIIFGSIYLIIFVLIIRFWKLEEPEVLMTKLFGKAKLKWRKRKIY